MSTEYIRQVSIKPDGVYLYSKSNDDDRPFHQWKCSGLTDVYRTEGQPGLDREIVRMLFEYAQIQGQHPSVTRFRPCLRDSMPLVTEHKRALDAEYAKLTPEDRKTIHRAYENKTDGARAYAAFERGAKNALYTQLAALADKLPDKNTRQASGLPR